MDFLRFFGLNEDPFKLTPDPSYFYPSASHNEGLLLMDYSVDQKEGFLLVIGDPGTGKTTLLKVFLEKWKDRAETAIVLTPRLTPEEFLLSIAEDFNISLENKNKNEIIRALRDFMTGKSAEDKRVIIIVDEAQNLPAETLEELRLLSNLETDKDKLIQIMLIGQPELETKLRQDNLRQLNQRITTRVHLGHFSQEETMDYIKYRAIKAGKENLQIHKNAGKLAYQLSNGVPRLINMLISRALMAAYIEESSRVLPGHIGHAVKSLNHSEIRAGKNHQFVPAAAGAVAVLMIIAAGVYLYTGNAGRDGIVYSEAPALKKEITDKIPGPVDIDQINNASITGIVADNTVNKEAGELTRVDKKLIPAARNKIAEHGPVDEVKQITNEINRETINDQSTALKFVYVNVDVAIIRKNPAIDAKIVGWSVKGSQLLVLNESMDDRQIRWYQISYQGEKNWISEEVVDLVRLYVTSYN